MIFGIHSIQDFIFLIYEYFSEQSIEFYAEEIFLSQKKKKNNKKII